jgi:hypothetical protein
MEAVNFSKIRSRNTRVAATSAITEPVTGRRGSRILPGQPRNCDSFPGRVKRKLSCDVWGSHRDVLENSRLL